VREVLDDWSYEFDLEECAQIGLIYIKRSMNDIVPSGAEITQGNPPSFGEYYFGTHNDPYKLRFELDYCPSCTETTGGWTPENKIVNFRYLKNDETDDCNPATILWSVTDTCCYTGFNLYALETETDDCPTAEYIVENGTKVYVPRSEIYADVEYSKNLTLPEGDYCVAIEMLLDWKGNCDDKRLTKIHLEVIRVSCEACDDSDSVQLISATSSGILTSQIANKYNRCNITNSWFTGTVVADNVGKISIYSIAWTSEAEYTSTLVAEQSYITEGRQTLSGTVGGSGSAKLTSDEYRPRTSACYYWRAVLTDLCNNIVQDFLVNVCVRCLPRTPSGCSSGCIASWTVINGEPTKDLTSFKNSGGTCSVWKIIETGAQLVYASGPISSGVLVGLPDSFTPASYSYPGYMCLEVS